MATGAAMERVSYHLLAEPWQGETVAWIRGQQLIRCSATSTTLAHSPHHV